ncbi:MAG: ATP-binding protein [Anaerolineaceae bacterium]|nr:ATP-binding protein [Anaerolineaceae bacterium]
MKKLASVSTNIKNSIKANSKKATEPGPESLGLREGVAIGDPNCPFCHGLGYVGVDVPMGDPRFGKLQVCTCRVLEADNSVKDERFTKSNLGALRACLFGNFHPRGRVGMGEQQANSLQQAFNLARNFAQTRKGWLLLVGRYGCGKTHLAAAIANQTLEEGVPTLFLTVPDLLDWLRSTYSGTGNFEERFDEIRNYPLLVLDDFGTQNATPWAQEKLFQIINQRYINKFPTVVTTNLDFEDFEGRIRSRLMDPELVTKVEINAPDYRNPTDEVGHPELSSLALHGKMRFDNFELRRDEGLMRDELMAVAQAKQIAEEYAKHPEGWLVFVGPYGSGKTHLAAAIGNYQAALGNPPLMVSVPDLLDHLRASFNPNSQVSLDKRFEEIKNARILILDDLGTQSATPWAREKLYQLFNYRYVAELPTVLTSSLTPDELDPRIYSRLIDERLTRFVTLATPAFSGKKPKPNRVQQK